jgi:general secretion pathway protein D
MNRKTFLTICMALVLAPGLMAQTNSGAPPQFPVQVPQRRVGRSNLFVPTNGPAALGASNQATRAGSAFLPPVAPPVIPPAPATVNPNPAFALGPDAAKTNAEVADYQFNFTGAPLKQLLDIYAELVDRTLIRAINGPEAVPDTTTIVLNTQHPVTRSEAILALETVLGMNGVTIVPIGDKFAKVVTEANAGSAAGPITGSNIPPFGKYVTQIIQLRYADPAELVKALEPFSKMKQSIIIVPSTETLILRDYAENVHRMMEMVEKIDVLTPNTIKPKVIPIKYALASDIASALSALGAGAGNAVGKSSSGANFKQAGSTGTTGTTGGFGGGTTPGLGGYPGAPAQGTTTSGLASSATSGRSTFQQNLQKIVGQAAGQGQFQLFGQTKIIADERTNSLLVFANDEDMKMITNIIGKLDVVLPQVLIDAIIMEINLNDTRNTGISYSAANGGSKEFSGIGGLNNLSSAASGFLTGTTTTNTANAFSGGSTLANLPGGVSYFGKYGNDLNVVLEAVAGDGRINVLSRPRIQTSHAVEADLFIGNTVPYVTGTYNYGYGSGPSAQYTQLEVGISLQVLPLINPDGLVVMDIQADVEQLGTPVAIEGVGNVPTTTKRQAGAKVSVRNGETIILGGFISDSRSTAISGIPGLMNIPGLGHLFRSTSIQNLRTELIMLMRPTVLPTPEVAAVVATQERDKLSGVKEAEYEIRREETSRNRKLERDLEKEKAMDEERAKKDAKKYKNGNVDPGTNTFSIQSIPAIEDQ